MTLKNNPGAIVLKRSITFSLYWGSFAAAVALILLPVIHVFFDFSASIPVFYFLLVLLPLSGLIAVRSLFHYRDMKQRDDFIIIDNGLIEGIFDLEVTLNGTTMERKNAHLILPLREISQWQGSYTTKKEQNGTISTCITGFEFFNLYPEQHRAYEEQDTHEALSFEKAKVRNLFKMPAERAQGIINLQIYREHYRTEYGKEPTPDHLAKADIVGDIPLSLPNSIR